MYSHHHYSHDHMSRENTNVHSLARPASMPSLYPSNESSYKSNQDLIDTHRSSLDSHGSYANAAVAAGWSNNSSSSSWNHNHHHDDTTTPHHGDSSQSNSRSSMDLPSIDKHSTNNGSNSNNNNSSLCAYNTPNYFVSSTMPAYNTGNSVTGGHSQQQPPSSNSSSYYGLTNPISGISNQARHSLVARPKLTTTLWEDEGTICYQVDAQGICVARRQDNDMINGTKLLNVAGMSRGKRDGILKNEKGRVVVKVGAMHLKGVWITFARAKLLAAQYKIQETLYPLFVDDPSVFLYVTPLHSSMASSRLNGLNGYRTAPTSQYGGFGSHPSEANSGYRNAGFHSPMVNHPISSGNDDMFMLSSQVEYGSSNSNNNNGSSSNRHSIGGLVSNGSYSNTTASNVTHGSYSTTPGTYPSSTDQQQDDTTHSSAWLPGQKTMLPGALSSPTSSEAGNRTSAFHLPPSRTSSEYENSTSTPSASSTTTSTNTSSTAERRQSLVMSTTPRMTNPRHHPYMSPGKVYAPSIMSSLQSYRSSLDEERPKDTNEGNVIDAVAAAAAAAGDMNRHPW